MDDATETTACLAARDDYVECLHHHKEVRWFAGLAITSGWRVVHRCLFCIVFVLSFVCVDC